MKRQENWVLAWRVCVCRSVCLCEKDCQRISYKRVDRFGWKLRRMLQLASNREPPLTSTIGPLIPPNLGRGWFLHSLKPYVSKTIKDIEKQRKASRRKIWWYTNLILYIFSISVTVFEIFWKNCLKKIGQGLGVAKTSWLGSKHV